MYSHTVRCAITILFSEYVANKFLCGRIKSEVIIISLDILIEYLLPTYGQTNLYVKIKEINKILCTEILTYEDNFIKFYNKWV